MYIFTIYHNFRQKSKKYVIREILNDGSWNIIFTSYNLTQAKIFLDTIGFQIIDYTRKFDKRLNINTSSFFNFDFSEYYFKN